MTLKKYDAGPRRRRHLEIEDDRLVSEQHFQVLLNRLTSDQRYLDIDTDNLDRISMCVC